MATFFSTLIRIILILSRETVRWAQPLPSKPVMPIILSVIGGAMNLAMLRYAVPGPPWHLLNALWPLVPVVRRPHAVSEPHTSQGLGRTGPGLRHCKLGSARKSFGGHCWHTGH